MTITCFRVGGAVRDRLLRQKGWNLPKGDTDWVVVGATPQEMTQAGYRPVGADFPVFLHPITHEEYALARTERKTAAGYHGFQFYAAPDVSLEEDLKRRDLTINAMAEDDAGNLFDPYGGQKDLDAHILRHVSPAFAEDPVRILRTARFAAKFSCFSVAPETLSLMHQMVSSGEADALVAERVWAEFKKGLMEKNPTRMIDVLIECGFWQRFFPDIEFTKEKRVALQNASQRADLFEIRAVLLFMTPNATETSIRHLFQRLRASSETIELAILYVRVAQKIRSYCTLTELADIFEMSDILRRPSRFSSLLRLLTTQTPEFCLKQVEKGAYLWGSVDAGQIAHQAISEGKQNEIAQRVRAARLKKLRLLTEENGLNQTTD